MSSSQPVLNHPDGSAVEATHLRQVLTVVAVTDLVDAALIATVTDLSPHDVRRCLDAAMAAGQLAGASPHLTVTARGTLLGSTTGSALGALHSAVLDALSTRGPLPVQTAGALVTSGCRDPRLAEHLVSSASHADAADADLITAWAETAGADPLRLAAQAAERAVRSGDFDAALRAGERVLADPDHASVPVAVRAVAIAHAHRGMVHHSAALFGFLGEARIGNDAALAVWAMLGDGDAEQARRMAALARNAPPTSVGRGLALMSRGLELSLDGGGEAALPVLVQSAAALRPLGDELVVPESPAALAALVAISTGEVDTAARVLTAAIDAGFGGSLQQSRHHLLLAWSRMLQGDLPGATTIADRVADSGPLALRDQMFLHGLRLGIARRAGDLVALDRAWNEVRVSLAEFSVDLYSLLPLGELAVAAARLRESHRLQTHLLDAGELLDSLGRPPLWAAMFHWYGVHAAILAEEPSQLLPHADALVHGAQDSRVAAILARAGQTWLRVLQGDVDAAAVTCATGDLELIGLSWDATRLAAQAAGRTTDRQVMLELMQLARAAHRTPVADVREDGETAPLRAQLTDREWEVAMLVLTGVGYREIGERLFISPKTVEHHVARIRRRLGADTRREMLTMLRGLAVSEQPAAD